MIEAPCAASSTAPGDELLGERHVLGAADEQRNPLMVRLGYEIENALVPGGGRMSPSRWCQTLGASTIGRSSNTFAPPVSSRRPDAGAPRVTGDARRRNRAREATRQAENWMRWSAADHDAHELPDYRAHALVDDELRHHEQRQRDQESHMHLHVAENGGEEAGVLDVVPGVGAQTPIVERGDMPRPEGDDERDPAHSRVGENVSQPAERVRRPREPLEEHEPAMLDAQAAVTSKTW
jgi:hypothetical protein